VDNIVQCICAIICYTCENAYITLPQWYKTKKQLNVNRACTARQRGIQSSHYYHDQQTCLHTKTSILNAPQLLKILHYINKTAHVKAAHDPKTIFNIARWRSITSCTGTKLTSSQSLQALLTGRYYRALNSNMPTIKH